MSEMDVGSLIAATYDAALEPGHWPQALHVIGAALGGASAIAAAHPWSGGVLWAAIDGLDPASLPRYDDDFSSSDSNPYFKLCREVPLGEPISAETFAAPAVFEETAFFRQVLAPQKLRHSVIVTLLRDDHYMAAVAFLRSASSGAFTAAELDVLRALAPHLQRAVRLTLRAEYLRAESTVFLQALSLSPTATLFADAGGYVSFFNPAAAQLLQQSDGLTLRSGFIEIGDEHASGAFRSRLEEVATLRDVETERPQHVSPIVVRRASGRAGYQLFVWPLQVNGSVAVDAPVAVVLVTDPAGKTQEAVTSLVAIYGLTPAQADVAALVMRGLPLKQIAAELSVSINTVKSHVRQLFAKTNTHRRTDLLRLSLEFPPLPPLLAPRS